MTRVVLLSSLLASLAFAGEKPRVAVLYFDINSTDPEHQVLKKGLAEMLITDIANDPAITVIERSRLEEVLAELKLQQSDKIDPGTAQKMGKLLGAHYLVWGSLTMQKGTGRLDAKVVEVLTGKITAAAVPLKDGELFDAELKVAEKLNGILAKSEARDPPPAPKKQGRLSVDNAVKYSQALDAIDKKDKKGAKEKLEAVVKAQPDFLLASLELDRLMK
jgi:TolB-like protein